MTTFQPEWAEASEREGTGILLSARQRDYLASYSDEVVVELLGQDNDTGAVEMYGNGNLPDEEDRRIVLPWEGFLTQPQVSLDDGDEVPDAPPEA